MKISLVKRILTHLSVQMALYCIIYHIYNFFYLSLHLISYWWGGIIFMSYSWFIMGYIFKKVDSIEKRHNWPAWLAIGCIGTLGCMSAFLLLVCHNGFFHVINKFEWRVDDFWVEAKLAFLLGIPAFSLAELVWRSNRMRSFFLKVALSVLLILSYVVNDTRIWRLEEREIFDLQHVAGELQYFEIDEASGLAASRIYPNIFYTHNDLGDSHHIFIINRKGAYLGELILEGVDFNDMEDLAIGPGPEKGTSFLYIGDIGNNQKYLHERFIYRLPEPDLSTLSDDSTILTQDYDKIIYTYPDGRRDAETLLIDPISKDLFVVSKREINVHVYRAAFPQPVNQKFDLEKVMELPVFNIVAGDISPDGSEILLKTYEQVFYWKRVLGQSVMMSMKERPVILPYIPEPQGEAIAWSADGKYYYTLSEKLGRQSPRLYFYPRLSKK